MIDLSILESKTFDVKLKDGRIVNILQPTVELNSDLIKMLKLIKANEEEEKILNVIFNFLKRVFNRNINDIKFTEKEIQSQFGVKTAMYLMEEYQKWTYSTEQELKN